MIVPSMTKIVVRKYNKSNSQYLDALNNCKAEVTQVTNLKNYAEDLERRITALEGQATDNTAKFNEHLGKIKRNEAAISSNATRIGVIENKMKELLKEGDTLQDLKKKMDLLDKAAEEGTLAGVSAEAWRNSQRTCTRLQPEKWEG